MNFIENGFYLLNCQEVVCLSTAAEHRWEAVKA